MPALNCDGCDLPILPSDSELEATCLVAEHRRQAVSRREGDDTPSLREEHRAREHDERIGVLSGHPREFGVDQLGAPRLHEMKPEP